MKNLFHHWQHKLNRFQFACEILTVSVCSFWLFNAFIPVNKVEKHTIGTEVALPVGGAIKVANASGGYLVSLTKPGDGIKFSNLPAARKLAIRYASVEVGTISVTVNDQPASQVNVHSSGSLTGSFLYSIVWLIRMLQ